MRTMALTGAMPKAVVLGTGASSGTLDKLGGVAGFTTRLGEVRRDWRTHYPDLARVIDDCGGFGDRLDIVWTTIDYRSKFRAVLGPDYGWQAAIQLRKAVLEAYSFSTEIRDLLAQRPNGVLTRVLSDLEPGDTLISFNWDTLAETIAIRLLGKGLVQGPVTAGEGQIVLLKPHGSLSWVHSSDGVVSRIVAGIGSTPLLEPVAQSAVQAEAGFYQPLLLGAVPMKSELLAEVQCTQPELYDTVMRQWKALVWAISSAEHITFVGYGFPPEDSHGRFLFREAVRRAPVERSRRLVRFYARQSDRPCLERALADVFGAEQHCEYAGEVTGGAA
jgi:hypothetical protein